jgi:hypothetical protein
MAVLVDNIRLVDFVDSFSGFALQRDVVIALGIAARLFVVDPDTPCL